MPKQTAVQMIIDVNHDTQEFNEAEHPVHLKIAEIRKFVSVNLTMQEYDDYMACEIGSEREQFIDNILKLIK
jgi:hypothetical protein